MAAFLDIPRLIVVIHVIISCCVHESFPSGACPTNTTFCGVKSVKVLSEVCSNVLSFIDQLLTLDIQTVRNSAICVANCFQTSSCGLAFTFGLGTSGDACVLMSNVYGSSLSWEFETGLPDCRVFLVQDNVVCQNCGTVDGVTCVCPANFYGPFCQFAIPTRCMPPTSWTPVEESDYPDAERLQVPMKVVVTYDEDDSHVVHRADSFYHNVDEDAFLVTTEPTMSLELPEQSFSRPGDLEFLLFGLDPNMESRRLTLDGGTYQGGQSNKWTYASHMTYKMEYFLSDWIFYDSAWEIGSAQDILSGLSQGHRLMSRTPVQVAFNLSNEWTAYVTKISHGADHNDTHFLSPMQLTSFKDTLHTDERFEASYRLGQGILSTFHAFLSRLWAMDDCWYPLQATANHFLYAMLRDMVLRGHEIRVVVGDDEVAAISADVIQTTVASNDVIVELAPRLTPSNANLPLDFGSQVVRTAISLLSGTRANCTRDIGVPDFYLIETGEFTDNVRWFVGMRAWKNVLKTNGHGVILEGSVVQLYSPAKTGYDVRVCLERSEYETMCMSDFKLVCTNTTHPQVLLQTRPFLRMDVDANGYFNGLADPYCRSIVYLISSDGWVKGIKYVEGNATTAINNNINVEHLTWFINIA